MHFHLHCILGGGLLMDIGMRWLCGVHGNVVIGCVGEHVGSGSTGFDKEWKEVKWGKE